MVYDMLGGMRAWTWETEPCVDSDSKYGGGTGEPNDPYLIYTAEQLNAIGAEPNDWDKHFQLMADIDLSDYSYDRAVIAPDTNDVNDGFQGTPFTGEFDGNDHTISNLTIAGESYLGLFGRLETGAEVKNLGLLDVNIIGSVYVGGLVGCNGDWHQRGGSVTHCCSTGVVSGNSDVGGLVGINYGDGSIARCYAICTVQAEESGGGLLGNNVGLHFWLTDGSDWIAEVSDCYSIVLGGSRVSGLLVGKNGRDINGAPSVITNCYSSSRDSGMVEASGLVGTNVFGEVFNCFWDAQISGVEDNNEGGISLTTVEMQTQSTFTNAGWDFVGEMENGTEDIWSICEGTNYPRFVWQIAAGDFVCPDGITIADFSFFLEYWLDDNCDLSNDYCQGTDLDQSGTVDENDLEILFESWSVER
jgi:hypothetical protein